MFDKQSTVWNYSYYFHYLFHQRDPLVQYCFKIQMLLFLLSQEQSSK